MTLGLTVGKFYPFHRGHEHLLRRASAEVDHLVVLVAWKPDQELPGPLRAAWIRAVFPTAEVIEVLDDIPDETAPWVARTREVMGHRLPDAVFSSEPYGPAYASGLGARSVVVDVDRKAVPVSGTALRADLGAHWSYLTSPAKAYLARRVCVLGVDSSGTTTMARALAQALETAWVPEYGRTYWEGRRYTQEPGAWEESEFIRIARRQQAAEDDLAPLANRVLICDTDAQSTALWHERYRGTCSAAVEELADGRRHDLYLLTEPDFPFVQDGTRECLEARDHMHTRFLATLAKREHAVARLSGPHESRLEHALRAIEPLLHFAPMQAP